MLIHARTHARMRAFTIVWSWERVIRHCMYLDASGLRLGLGLWNFEGYTRDVLMASRRGI